MEMVVEDVVTVDKDAFVASPRPKPQKWLLCPQRAEDIKALCRVSGARHLLFASPYILAYFGAIALQFATDRLWANLLLSAALGQLLYCLFVLHHDCMHRTAFQNDLFNRMMGRFYALTFTMTFTTNRETHARHHAHIADPDRDPDEYYFAAGLKDIWLRIWRYYEWYTRISLTKYGTRVRWTVLAEQVTNLTVWLLVHVLVIRQGLGVKMLFIFWLPDRFRRARHQPHHPRLRARADHPVSAKRSAQTGHEQERHHGQQPRARLAVREHHLPRRASLLPAVPVLQPAGAPPPLPARAHAVPGRPVPAVPGLEGQEDAGGDDLQRRTPHTIPPDAGPGEQAL